MLRRARQPVYVQLRRLEKNSFMTLRDIFSLSLKSLLRTKGRAVLTMLGIIIGIASVILTLAIGQAAESFLLSQVASFGSNLIFVANGKGDQERGGPPEASIKQTLTMQDFYRLQREPWVEYVNAASIANDVVSANGVNLFSPISGTTYDEVRIFSSVVEKGRFITDEDVVSRSRVIVLGASVAKKLFSENDPVGKTVKVGRRTYRVVGVMAVGGTRFFTKLDDQVYIPVTAVLDQYNREKINFISLTPKGLSVEAAKDRARLVLRDTHNLDNPQGLLSKDDFRVASQEDAARSAAMIGTVLQTLLGSIAAISLVVGGIGIMNIMFVTVTERTQEIGLRKALGATRRDVLGQFLMEALLLTFVGGAIGVVFGLTLSVIAIQIINQFQEGWAFVFPLNGVILAFSVSAFIGLVFGYYPARRAATLNPIESLRYE